MKNDSLRSVWRTMKARCNNPKSEKYYTYGARGIKVCDEWQNAETFMQWAKDNGYKKGLQIDRINNDGNYEPSNCRFVTGLINAGNKGNSVKITFGETTLTASQWGRKLKVPGKLIIQRLARGWTVEDALTKEFKKDKNKSIVCLNNGKRYDSIKDAAQELSLFQSNISKVILKERKSTGGYVFELV